MQIYNVKHNTTPILKINCFLLLQLSQIGGAVPYSNCKWTGFTFVSMVTALCFLASLCIPATLSPPPRFPGLWLSTALLCSMHYAVGAQRHNRDDARQTRCHIRGLLASVKVHSSNVRELGTVLCLTLPAGLQERLLLQVGSLCLSPFPVATVFTLKYFLALSFGFSSAWSVLFRHFLAISPFIAGEKMLHVLLLHFEYNVLLSLKNLPPVLCSRMSPEASFVGLGSLFHHVYKYWSLQCAGYPVNML